VLTKEVLLEEEALGLRMAKVRAEVTFRSAEEAAKADEMPEEVGTGLNGNIIE
jgi:hypothetical protein